MKTTKTAYPAKSRDDLPPPGGLTFNFTRLEQAGFRIERGSDWVNVTGPDQVPHELIEDLVAAVQRLGLNPPDVDYMVETAINLHLWAALRRHMSP